MKLLLALVALVAVAWPAAAQEPSLDDASDDAVTAIRASLQIDQTLLEEDQIRYEEMAELRTALSTRLAELRRALDEAVPRSDPAANQRLDLLVGQIDRAEGERAQLMIQERSLIDRIGDRLRRIRLLEEQLSQLAGREHEERGALTGVWDIVLLPVDQRGTCVLRQTGTLVSGTYRLDGDLSGSLQGTLINRKVYLVRIDSKLGRSMELEGFLSSDGEMIRGGWLNYELAGGDGAQGNWSARRRPRESQPLTPGDSTDQP